jgi:hypothetical protein
MLLEPFKRTKPFLHNEQMNWKVSTFMYLYKNSKLITNNWICGAFHEFPVFLEPEISLPCS